ncbi:MAG: HTH domain-containing protein [Sulfolobales archaeon]
MKVEVEDLSSTASIVYDPIRGEYINILTGEVVYDGEIADKRDWRAYTAEEHAIRARTGPGYTAKVHDGGITTFIEGSNKYSSLQRRLRKPSDSATRKEIEAKKILNEIAGVIGLPEIVVEDSGMLIKKAVSRGLVKRKNIESIIGAIVYRTAYVRKIDLDKDLLIKVLGITRKKLFKTLKKLEWENLFDEFRDRISRQAREKDLGSICGGAATMNILERIEASQNVKEVASRILRSLSKLDPLICSGKNPKGLVGAVVYIASIISNEKISQQELARRLGVSEVTIRNRYRNIVDEVDLVVFV